jgi:branched-chain amino acid transport system substrate-binding protein
MLEEEINKVGVLGRPIKLVIEDDQSNPTEAVTAVNKLLQQDKVIAVLGGSISASTLAIKPITDAAGIPLMAMAASNKITEPPIDWVWRAPPRDALAVGAALGYIQNTMKFTKIAVLSDENAYGASGLADIEARAGDFGLTVVAKESYKTEDTDLTAQLTKLKAANPEVIVVWGTNPGPAVAAKNMKQLGMTQPFVGSHGIANKSFIDLAGDAAEGVIFPAGRLLVPDSYTNPEQKAIVDQFVAAFTAAAGNPPPTFAGHAFGALRLLLEAINKAGSTDAAAIQTALNATTGVITPDGVYNYSATDHDGLTPDDLTVVQIKGGTWVLAPQ